MAQNYAYAYAEIDPSTGMCIGVMTSTSEVENPIFIAIPEYNEDYFMKYYNQADGKWYLEDTFTTEWTPA